MNLIELSLRRTVFAWILMIGLITFGGFALTKLGVSQLPDVDFPVIDVSVDFEGAGPEIVEAEIVDRIESQLISIEGVKEMRSSVREGSGSVRLELDINRNVDVALQEVQTAVSQIRFPTGVDPAVVRKTNPEEQPILFMSLVAEKATLHDMIVFADQFLLDQFRFLPEIGEVEIRGFSDRNLRVWPDLKKLQRLELTILDVIDAITTQHVEAAAGQLVEKDRELRVRWLGEAGSVEEIKKLRLLKRGGQNINDVKLTVGDVAEVEDGLTDIRRIARVDGRPALSISVRKQRGANEVALADRVVKHIEKVKPLLPEGYNLGVRVNFTAPTKATVNTSIEKLFVAAIVTILVCFLFLGSWQAALNILFSIPTSIVGTFLFLYFFDFTLNLFTLLALTLAISIVVDDAIMLLENIVRHYRMGKSPYQAAYDGAMEILPAATAATLAVVAVFAPVIFMDGITGKFFFQFGIAMSIAVLLSLLEAVTITPMRAAAFMSSSPKISNFEKKLDHIFEKLAEHYRTLLASTLRHSGKVVFISLLGFVVSMVLLRKVNREFVPLQDQNFILLNANMPPGTSLQVTSKAAEQIEAVVREVPEVAGFLVSVGGGGGGASAVNQVFMPIALKDRGLRSKTHLQVMDVIRKGVREKNVKGLRVNLRDISSRNLTTGRQFPVSFNLTGPDFKVLSDKAQEIMKQLTAEGLAQDMDTDFRLGTPELEVEPLREELAKKAVTVETVAKTLNAAIAGLRVSRYTASGRRYDIRVKVPEDQMTGREDIKNVFVRNQFGNIVPLDDLVLAKEEPTLQSITRINRQRSVGVFGQLTAGQSQARVVARAEELARQILPDGYGFSLDGSAAGLAESFRSLTMALLLGVLVAYMVLAV